MIDKQVKMGYVLGIGSFVLWGLFPLYFRLLQNIPSPEIVAHRILWSALFAGGLLIIWKHVNWWQELVKNPQRIGWLALSGTLVCSNWVLYIWAINHGHVLAASLGYYINPLVNVLLALCLLGERLRRMQWMAVILAIIGVLQQMIQVGSSAWISLYLAFSFGLYGLIRKKIVIAPLPGLFIETVLICPIAVAWLLFNPHITSMNMAFLGDWQALWILLTGPVTIIPLIFFNTATRTLPYTTIGFMQYIAPTLLVLQAVFVFNEPVNHNTLITFVFIWSALIIYSLDVYIIFRKNHYEKVT